MGGLVSRWSTGKAQLPPNEDVKDEDPVLTRTLDFAWVTLATNDSYSMGALVLAHSLRNAKTLHKLVVLVTPAVSPLMREQLSTVFDVVKVVDVLDSKDEAHLALLRRPELGITFTKLHCWRLTEFEKCVFLDADTLVIRNCDELFEREELSAAPDVGWPDCFNTGVFVFKPSEETFNNLIKFAMEQGSFDGGDQGLLNQYFDDWASKDIKKHLPFVYNLTSVAVYSYIPAFKRYGSDVRIVHFIGTGKPWLQQLNPSTRTVNPAPGSEHLAPLLQMWWDIFCEKVHPSMPTNLECDSGMSNDEIEACANNVPLDTEPAELIQPFTYYTDKDDSRQINLPYHPFDVKSSSGELLNITYLEQREREVLEEMSSQKAEEQEQNEQEKNHSAVENEGIKEKEEEQEQEQEQKTVFEPGDNEHKEVEDKETEEIGVMEGEADTGTEIEISASQEMVCEPQKEEEKKETPQQEKSSFDCDTFFPDEICVQNYLEKNFHTYQSQGSEHKNSSSEVTLENPHLPRFLTMAEDDQRQRLNVTLEEPSSQSPPSPQLQPTQNALSEAFTCPLPEKELGEGVVGEDSQEIFYTSEVIPEAQASKSAPSSEDNLLPPKPVEETSSRKSHVTGNVDPNKKYLMPKLKPLLPKQSVTHETVDEGRPKITQYTEFHMNCDYEDFVPCDKLGFVERHILEEVKINEMDKDTKLKTLSYIFPHGKNIKGEDKKVDLVPGETFDEMTDYDLSLCQRQKGNQPIASANNRHNSGENTCFLPVLKPLKPSKGKRLSSNGYKSKDRGTKAKVESRKAREKAKTETKSNIQPTSVEDVLKRLISFSKGYQKYFTGFVTEEHKSDVAAPPNVIKNGYNESSESPRLQYSKEFDDNMETPLENLSRSEASPLLNGGSSAKYNGESSAANYSMVTQASPGTGVTVKDGKTGGEVEELTVSKKVYPKLSEKPARPGGESGYRVESSDFERGDATRKVLTVGRSYGINGENGNNELVTASREAPVARSADVKREERMTRTVPTTSSDPGRKTKKRHRWSAVPKTDKVRRRVDVAVKTESAPPHSSAAEPTAKPTNIYTLLPEDISDETTADTGKARSVSRRGGKTHCQSVRKKREVTRKVKAAPSVDAGTDNSGIAGAIAKLSLQPGGLPGTESESASSAQEDYVRRQNWEMGTMDYMGRDSFTKIWSKICKTLDEKITHDTGLDNASKQNKGSPPSEKTESDSLIPEKQETHDTPDEMRVEKERSEEVPSRAHEIGEGSTSESASKTESAAPDLSSKASQALEAFGKLFVSGPVVIKSEESQDVSKPNDANKSPSLNNKKEETGSEGAFDRKKSIETDEEAKKKKGVLSKILGLVGVEPSATPTSVFYDTEEPATKSQSMGSSVFYDTDYGQGSAGDMKVPEESSIPLRQRSSSPSLKLKTTPGTEIVPPTPPPTPLTDKTEKIPAKDDKFLVADETIMETPPVTDKKLLEDASGKEAVKSEVEKIIETAVQYAEEQLDRVSQEGDLSKAEKISDIIPKANEALEAFGKLFVSGPVTIKSEVLEDVRKSLETTEKEKPEEAAADETVKERAGEANIAAASEGVVSPEITQESTPKTADSETNALAEKTKQVEMYSTEDAEASSKSPQSPQAVAKTEESLTESLPSELSPDSQAKDKEKPSEPSKPGEATEKNSQKPGESEKSSVVIEKSAALPESIPGSQAKDNEKPSEPSKPAEETRRDPEKPDESEKSSVSTVTSAGLTEPVPDALTKSGEEPFKMECKEPKPELAEKLVAQENSSTPTEPPAAPSESVQGASTKPEVSVKSEEKPQEICPELDEKSPKKCPESVQKEADAVVKAQDTTLKPKTGELSAVTASTEAASEGDSLKNVQEISSPTSQVPSVSEKESGKNESTQSQSLLSKASEALEAFGKVFTSGPVVLKSEVPENLPGPTKVGEEISSPSKEASSSEALEAFGKVFVSGPVTIKSQVEEPDAVHPVFQTKPEEEPIYCNIDEVEEIKVTSEEDRKKEKPQSSKLTEQILRAIPPQDRKPFTEASSVSSEVSQLLASIEPQNMSILLDKPVTDEMVTAEGEDSGSVPPVPPRRNRSKGRDAPLPPPKKKGKNDKS